MGRVDTATDSDGDSGGDSGGAGEGSAGKGGPVPAGTGSVTGAVCPLLWVALKLCEMMGQCQLV